MRIAMIGSARFGVDEPLAGGLETMMVALSRELASLGHHVTMFAGSRPGPRELAARLTSEPLLDRAFTPSEEARADVSMPAEHVIAEHHAYLKLSVTLRERSFDVVHNHSLHHLPPLYDLCTPMVHTLHSPPTPWLQSAFSCGARPGDLVASVSEENARRWGGLVDRVVPNGVDTDRWRPGGERTDRVVWTGRLVPEKAPHLAIDAARRAGREIALAGPLHDRRYYDEEIVPRLAADACYVGHLRSQELAALVAGSAVAVVTPMWPEPYGLVVAEALAVGTPVAAFACGGVPEVLDAHTGVLAEPGDVGGLAAAIEAATRLSRRACRARALAHCSMRAMASRYLAAYRDVAGERAPGSGGRALHPLAS